MNHLNCILFGNSGNCVFGYHAALVVFLSSWDEFVSNSLSFNFPPPFSITNSVGKYIGKESSF